jgi:hypothetical protein
MVKHFKSSEKAEYPEILELVHMIDTGGQPELLENLPSLIHHCHLAILVLNLMFGLDEHPSIDYHKEGKALKRVAPFQYSNRQIIPASQEVLPERWPGIPTTGSGHTQRLCAILQAVSQSESL